MINTILTPCGSTKGIEAIWHAYDDAILPFQAFCICFTLLP